jgi:two-component system nitrogen regulation response regulator GlnG
MSLKHILIVDDEEAVCWALERALTREGHRVTVASSAEDAFECAGRQRFDAVILDVRLPGLDGLSALARLRELTQDAPVIIVTAFGNLSTAVRAVEGGAFDYLAKPFDLSQALDAVTRALTRRSQQAANATESVAPPGPEDEIVGASAAMQTVFKRIALVAPRDASVLITGESGTGKELIARAIHRHSSRRDRPFLPVHIAALNPNLVESELFGHVKGAFTGAGQARPGFLALADGGTVFLDELADIPLPVQVKLLRVLENNEVLPVGSNQAQSLHIRRAVWPRVCSGTTCSSASTCSRSTCLHCASGRKTFPCWLNTFCAASSQEHYRCRPRRLRFCKRYRGSVMCANCGTHWNMRPLSRAAGRCCRNTSRPFRCPRRAQRRRNS